ncbi:MAG: histidine kinase dimerization/phospho-acceptor domain-containing protein, partial [Pseudomonadota bacterium]
MGIAHDFNNILAAILAFSELVKRHLPPGTAASDDINQIINSGTRAATLVQQILEFSHFSWSLEFHNDSHHYDGGGQFPAILFSDIAKTGYSATDCLSGDKSDSIGG